MKTYVINLASATGRLAYMTRCLERIGIPFERFDALNPERAELHPGRSRIAPMSGRQWIPNEIACLLSHYEVWKLIAAGDDDYGMVLEDDLIMDSRLKRVFDGLSGVPVDADLVKLETGGYFPVFLSRRVVSMPGGPEYRRLLSGHYGSGAYLLSREGARKLMKSDALFDMPVDNMLFFPEHAIGKMLRTYQCVPGLAIQNVDQASHLRVAELDLGMQELRADERERSLANDVQIPVTHIPFSQRLRNYRLRLFAIRMIIPIGAQTEDKSEQRTNH